MRVHGWDIGLNHSGFIELTDGELTGFWYVTDLASSASKSKTGTRLVLPRTTDRQQAQMARLAWWESYIAKRILVPRKPDIVAIEDYALDASHGAHYKGEIGGIARILCWFRGVQFRLHDPVSVKMFAAHDGTCQKDQVERAVEKRWGWDFSNYNPPLAKPTKRTPNPRQNRQTSEDLADAYALAQLAWVEYQLRKGLIKLSNLHEKEVRVFNRVTKSYPVNLLDREWLQNPDGVPTPHGEPVCPKCGSRKCCLANPKRKKAVA